MRRKSLQGLTALSLAANFLLGLRLVNSWHAQRPTITDAQSTAESAPVAGSSGPASTLRAPEQEDASLNFHWNQVESTNMAEYAQNLRRAGFPEMAVKDSLIPQIIGNYTQVLREHARLALAPKWANAPEAVVQQHRYKWDEAKRQQRQLLKSLFGEEPERLELYKPWQFEVRQEELPFLDDPLREWLNSLKRERSQARSALRERGISGAELEAGLRPIIERQEEELKGVLTTEVYQRLVVGP